jgi:hypothetical protein
LQRAVEEGKRGAREWNALHTDFDAHLAEAGVFLVKNKVLGRFDKLLDKLLQEKNIVALAEDAKSLNEAVGMQALAEESLLLLEAKQGLASLPSCDTVMLQRMSFMAYAKKVVAKNKNISDSIVRFFVSKKFQDFCSIWKCVGRHKAMHLLLKNKEEEEDPVKIMDILEGFVTELYKELCTRMILPNEMVVVGPEHELVLEESDVQELICNVSCASAMCKTLLSRTDFRPTEQEAERMKWLEAIVKEQDETVDILAEKLSLS